jgi:hypothetical protein
MSIGEISENEDIRKSMTEMLGDESSVEELSEVELPVDELSVGEWWEYCQ